MNDLAASAYPPSPWVLAGTAQVGLWRLRAGEVPWDLPSGATPITLRGRPFVGVAFVAYRGGVLDYDELAVAMPVRFAGRRAVTVTRIWVDSVASLAGGRALWGIPKEMAAFRGAPNAISAHADGVEIARLRAHPRIGLPGLWPLRFTLAQTLHGLVALTPAALQARITFVRSRWDFASNGPLSVLSGRPPIATLRIAPMTLRFGG